MRFGVSEIYSALDWARAYKEFLENWSTIVKALARFAWKLKTKGGQNAVAAAKSKLNTTLSTTSHDTNPPTNTAGTAIMTEGVDLTPLKTAGVQTKATDGKPLRQMVASAMGIYEHYISGDPSTGNLATTKTMEYPMLMMFRERQQLWTSVLLEIMNFVIDAAIMASWLPGRFVRNKYGEKEAVLANDTANEDPAKRSEPIDRTVVVTFPDILEKSIKERIDAVMTAATLDGKPLAGTLDVVTVTRLMLEALGLDDIDEYMELLFPGGKVPETDDEGEEGGEGNGSKPKTKTKVKEEPTVEEQFSAALRDLQTAIKEATVADPDVNS
jgi:hypothetical protein